jgi:hypothetical protein
MKSYSSLESFKNTHRETKYPMGFYLYVLTVIAGQRDEEIAPFAGNLVHPNKPK